MIIEKCPQCGRDVYDTGINFTDEETHLFEKILYFVTSENSLPTLLNGINIQDQDKLVNAYYNVLESMIQQRFLFNLFQDYTMRKYGVNINDITLKDTRVFTHTKPEEID